MALLLASGRAVQHSWRGYLIFAPKQIELELGMSPEISTEWVPLVEFAARKGVSLSTLRRYIKARKIEYRVENGRYMLKDSSPTDLKRKVERLEKDLKKAQNEIAELKTLVALYEERYPGAT